MFAKSRLGIAFGITGFVCVLAFQNCGKSFVTSGSETSSSQGVTSEQSAYVANQRNFSIDQLVSGVANNTKVFASLDVDAISGQGLDASTRSSLSKLSSDLGGKETKLLKAVLAPDIDSNADFVDLPRISPDRPRSLNRLYQTSLRYNNTDHEAKVSNQLYLQLKGTPFQMGYAHGYLRSQEIGKILQYYKNKPSVPYDDVVIGGDRYNVGINHRFRLSRVKNILRSNPLFRDYFFEIAGMVQGVNDALASGQSKVVFEEILFLQYELETGSGGCTAVGQKTSSGSAVARSVDWADLSADGVFMNNQLIISQESSLPNKARFISLSRAGVIGVYTGFSDSFYAEINSSGSFYDVFNRRNPRGTINPQFQMDGVLNPDRDFLYPAPFLIRDFVETINGNQADQTIKDSILNRYRQISTSPLKVMQLMVPMVYADGANRAGSFIAAIEGIGAKQVQNNGQESFPDPVFRIPKAQSESTIQISEESHQLINIVEQVTDSGEVLISDGRVVGRLQIDSNKITNVRDNSSLFNGQIQKVTNLAGRKMGLLNGSIDPSKLWEPSNEQTAKKDPNILGYKIFDGSSRYFLRRTQHGQVGKGYARVDFSYAEKWEQISDAMGQVVFSIDRSTNEIPNAGLFVLKNGQYGQVLLVSSSSQSSLKQGVNVESGDAFAIVGLDPNSERIPIGTYTKYGNFFIVGNFVLDGTRFKWIFHNPDLNREDLLVNNNSWYMPDRIEYTAHEDGVDAKGLGLLRLSTMFLHQAKQDSAFRGDLVTSAFARLAGYYGIFYEFSNGMEKGSATRIPDYEHPGQFKTMTAGSFQMSSVSLKNGKFLVSFSKSNPEVLSDPQRPWFLASDTENNHPIGYSFSELFSLDMHSNSVPELSPTNHLTSELACRIQLDSPVFELSEVRTARLIGSPQVHSYRYACNTMSPQNLEIQGNARQASFVIDSNRYDKGEYACEVFGVDQRGNSVSCGQEFLSMKAAPSCTSSFSLMDTQFKHQRADANSQVLLFVIGTGMKSYVANCGVDDQELPLVMGMAKKGPYPRGSYVCQISGVTQISERKIACGEPLRLDVQ